MRKRNLSLSRKNKRQLHVPVSCELLEFRRLMASTPYSGTAVAVPTNTIQAENFDKGGEGGAYHDLTIANQGGAYRFTDRVDIYTSTDTGGGYTIGTTRAGEWLQYSINVASAGNYIVSTRVTPGTGVGGKFHYSVGSKSAAAITLPASGGWQTVASSPFALSAGQQILRLTFDSANISGRDIGNVNWIQLTKATTPVTRAPFSGTPISIPGTVQAENYDTGGEGLAYHDTDTINEGGQYRADGVDIETTSDTGAGYNTGHTKPGEWLEYTINAATSGSYNLSLRYASGGAGGTGHFAIDGTTVGSLSFAPTGGWQTFQTITVSNVNISAGNHIMRLAFDTAVSGDIGNANWIGIAANSSTQPTAPRWPVSWTQKSSAPSVHYEAATEAFNGKLYVFGGFKNNLYQVDRTYLSYTPATDTWTNLGTLPSTMAESHQAVSTDGTYIYFSGGLIGDLMQDQDPQQIINSEVWRFNPANNTWLKITNLPAPRGAGVSGIINGKLHYVGGFSTDITTDFADHYVYDLTAGTWTTGAPTPNAKDHATGAVLNGKLYVMGGEHGHHTLHDQQKDVHVYDPITDAWTRLADMPIAKSHAEGATTIVDGKIVISGGQVDNFQPTTNVVAYDPVANGWTTLPNLPGALQGGIIQLVDDKIIYALGGTQTDSPQNITVIGSLT